MTQFEHAPIDAILPEQHDAASGAFVPMSFSAKAPNGMHGAHSPP